MLKVFKYDWKNGWNSVRSTLLIDVIVSILMGVLLGILGGEIVMGKATFAIMGNGNMDYVVMGLSLLWFGVMVALLVLTVDTIFRNMNSRMFGPEGYLTHTLPVDTWQLLLGNALGTWLFGVFMVFVAIASVLLIFVSTATSTGAVVKIVEGIIEYLPKLGAYHFKWIVRGAGYAAFALAAFLAGSFLMVVQFQFICIAARLFGKFRLAGGIIVFWLLVSLENDLNKVLSMGFVVVLLTSAACFAAGNWLLKHRLNI